MRALVIETAFLGDAIVSLSLAHAIKQLDPNAHVSYLVRPEAADIISYSPDVDRVIPYDKRGEERGIAGLKKKAEELRQLNCDTLFLLHSSRRSQALASLIDVKHKVGFSSMTHAGLTHTIVDSGWSNRYERAIFPLTAIRDGVDTLALPRLTPPPIPEFAAFFHEPGPVVALAPGSVWATKKWGDDKFVNLAKKLISNGSRVVVIGGRDESEVGAKISAACGDNVLDLTGKLPFAGSAAVIAQCSMLITNDSAPSHVAVAVGTKVLTIFGPTVPAFGFAPPRAAGETIELQGLWCRPCTSHGSERCPIYTHACMKEISIEMVFERAMGLLHEESLP